MTDTSIRCDVAIVGSGFAGSFIANELSKQGVKVVILEAGPGVQPNFNAFMKTFYEANAKVPESPYPPAVLARGKLIDPKNVAAGRPSALTTGGHSWKDPSQAYLDQSTSPRPFKSTYERLAGGTSHWMGLTPRMVPNDFRMKTAYGKGQANFPLPDWPIDYQTIEPFYERAEAELGVAADVAEQHFANMTFSAGYAYPMPKMPPSLFDQRVAAAVAHLTDDQTRFLGMGAPITGLKVVSQPAARNSQPYRNRRACAGNTNCIPICPIQAKYDPTITLNEATNNGTRLIDHAVANEILLQNDRVSGINFITYGHEGGPKTGSGRLEATVYVIAANGIETPRLLLMSKNGGRTPNGVANSSDMVGRNLMDHPQYLAWGLLPKPVFPYRGPLVTSSIGEICDGPFRSQRAAFRVSLGNEGWNSLVGSGQFGPDPHVTTLDLVNGMNCSGLNGPSGKSRALFGNDLKGTLNNLVTRQFRIAFPVEQSPDPNNRVTLSTSVDALNLPRPKINYDISEYTRRGVAIAFQMKNLIFKQLQAVDFTARAPGDPAGFDETIEGKQVQLTYGGAGHVMGTYRMGLDSKTSVVDAWQRSHDHPNLYLVGSGTFPTVGTSNPTLTLTALALRTVQDIVLKLRVVKS
ncbi:MAG: GMC family oxidoreductase [Proteobacteria bacterium]|nr:GMC family oxidoreductase [Pseudomonadota bacterium]